MGGSSKSSTQTQTIPAQTTVTPVSRTVSVVVGYKYYLGAHMALTHGPVDFVSRIKVGDKCAWSGLSYGKSDEGTEINQNSSGVRISISASNLFGGVDGEGGVSGPVDFLQGYDTQAVNDYLAKQLGGADGTPAFRGVTSMVLRQVYVSANNPYLKPWAFTMTRTDVTTGGAEIWNVEKAQTNGPRSPAQDCTLVPSFSVASDETEWPGLAADAEMWSSLYPNQTSPSQSCFENYTPNFVWSSGQVGSTQIIGGETYTFTGLRYGYSTPGTTYHLPEAVFEDSLWDSGHFSCGSPNTGKTLYRWSLLRLYPDQEPVPSSFTEVCDPPEVGPPPPLVANCESGPCIDMNPAHIIRECLTDKEWGMGYSVDDVDDVSFTAAADTLFDEELGISLLWDRETTIEAFIQEITRHIDAALYVDRRTGKFVLKLIRDDYSASDLITLDPTNIERVENYRRPSFGELINTVTVLYMECPDDVQGSVTVQDIALIQMQGGSIGATVEYMGFSNRRNAQYAATRDLRQLALPLLSCTIYTGPDAASLDIGDVFKFEWPDYHEDSITMRVTGMAFGDGKTNRIRIDCVQDVFGTPEAPLLSDDVSLWNNPNQPPGPVEHQIVEEAPYWLGVRVISDLDARLAESPDVGGFCAVAADPPSGLFDTSDGTVYYGNAISATINQNDGTEWVQVGLMDFCPFATVAGASDSGGTTLGGISYLDDTILIADASGLDLVSEGTFAQMGNEIVRIDSINIDSNGDYESITVGRGCLDTVPTPHDADTRIFFWQQFFGSDYDQYFAGDSFTYALRPRNNTGILPLADAPTIEHTFDSRAIRPYPPGNVRVNGQYYPEHLNGELLSLAWSHRDRTQQTGEVIIDTLETDIGPEAGTTYTVRIEDDFGGLILEETGIAGTTWNEDSNNLIEDASFVIKLYSERDIASSSDPYQSWQQHVIPMLRNAPVDASSSGLFGSSSEAALWTPSEITTALWLDAADSDTITLNSGNVSQWDDKSGNLRHATQGTSTDQPAFSTDKLVFDGTNDFLDLGTQLGRPINYTLFFVAKFTKAFSNNQALCAQLPSNGASALSSKYLFNRSNAAGKMEWSYGDGTNYRARRTATALTINTTTIIGLKHTDGVQDESVYFDGSLITNEDASYAAGTATAIGGAAQSWRIGRHGEFTTGSFFGGEIYEVIVLTSAASDTDRQKIEGYLAHRWGLTANLPELHPYKSVAP